MRHFLLACAMTCGLASTASGQWVPDQGNSTVWFNFENPSRYLAQSFTPTASNINRVRTSMTEHWFNYSSDCTPYACPPFPTTFSMYLSIWDGLPSDPASAQLAGDVVTFPYLGEFTPAILSFAPIAITPGQQYWIVVGQASSPYLAWWNHYYLNAYDGGVGCLGGANLTDAFDCGGTANDFDFVTYYDPNFSTVPEPSTTVLLSAAAVCLLLLGRSQRVARREFNG